MVLGSSNWLLSTARIAKARLPRENIAYKIAEREMLMRYGAKPFFIFF
jgi:hypothetical protein